MSAFPGMDQALREAEDARRRAETPPLLTPDQVMVLLAYLGRQWLPPEIRAIYAALESGANGDTGRIFRSARTPAVPPDHP